MKETFRMVNTILLVVIAIAIVVFVVYFIKSQIHSDDGIGENPLTGLFDKEETLDTKADPETGEESKSTAVTEGFNTEENGRIYYISQGERLKDTWLEAENALFLIDEDGYVKTGDYAEGAFRYTASASGAVQKITFNRSYNGSEEMNPDYPYAVKNSKMTVFLNPNHQLGRMHQIMVKKATETMSHQLGSGPFAQYTVPYSMQIGGGYVYWLPALQDPDDMEKLTANRLFRMRPGDEKRQAAAENVQGFKVVESPEGMVTVYYYADDAMHKCTGDAFYEDDTVIAFTEDMEYVLDTSTEGKLYLMTKSGYRVTQESDQFKVGNYVYSISAEGEVLSVLPSSKIELDGYQYEIALDGAFGVVRSAVARRKDGVREAISGEFFGNVGNMHLAKDASCIYAEYHDAMGNGRILRITQDGDVDMVNGFDPGPVEVAICGEDEEGLTVQVAGENGVTYEKVKPTHFTPVVLGIQPVKIGEDTKPESPAGVTDAPPAEVYQPGSGPASSGKAPGVTYLAPGVVKQEAPAVGVGKAP